MAFIPPGSVSPLGKNEGRLPVSQVQGVLRTFTKALASEGLGGLPDIVEISPAARTEAILVVRQAGTDGTESAKIAAAKPEGLAKSFNDRQ
jgi:hypothetical protein